MNGRMARKTGRECVKTRGGRSRERGRPSQEVPWARDPGTRPQAGSRGRKASSEATRPMYPGCGRVLQNLGTVAWPEREGRSPYQVLSITGSMQESRSQNPPSIQGPSPHPCEGRASSSLWMDGRGWPPTSCPWSLVPFGPSDLGCGCSFVCTATMICLTTTEYSIPFIGSTLGRTAQVLPCSDHISYLKPSRSWSVASGVLSIMELWDRCEQWRWDY